jgi:endonuclease III
MKRIKTWNERCEEHPDHQERIISERMIQERMQEEIDELRQALIMFQHSTKIFGPGLEELLNSAGFYRKREWVGLTDEELEEMHNEIKVRLMGTYRTEDIYRSIEAKLKEKNT